jgi:hypothetical protein
VLAVDGAFQMAYVAGHVVQPRNGRGRLLANR